eukprot:GHVQ01029088.1.p1 GENE.GHVQ01029088.1~~GHVQ01029088.1.p1  ORF type:complete len:136 (+),score=25.61 GHVQ01029088.1:128-535(+)
MLQLPPWKVLQDSTPSPMLAPLCLSSSPPSHDCLHPPPTHVWCGIICTYDPPLCCYITPCTYPTKRCCGYTGSAVRLLEGRVDSSSIVCLFVCLYRGSNRYIFQLQLRQRPNTKTPSNVYLLSLCVCFYYTTETI